MLQPLRRCYLLCDRGTRRVLLAAVHGYQRYLGWLLGGQCRFVPSCSFYAEEALERGPLWRAVVLIAWRLMRCQPIGKGGVDPVPEKMGGREYWLTKSPRPRQAHAKKGCRK